MSAAKFTPGPREVTREEGHGFESFVVSGARGRFIAQFTERADAVLDAAAPDLLENLGDSTVLLNALLGAMPPAIQKKWPSIVERSKARIARSLEVIATVRGGA